MRRPPKLFLFLASLAIVGSTTSASSRAADAARPAESVSDEGETDRLVPLIEEAYNALPDRAGLGNMEPPVCFTANGFTLAVIPKPNYGIRVVVLDAPGRITDLEGPEGVGITRRLNDRLAPVIDVDPDGGPIRFETLPFTLVADNGAISFGINQQGEATSFDPGDFGNTYGELRLGPGSRQGIICTPPFS